VVKELIVKLVRAMILPHLTTTAGTGDDEFLHSCLLGGLPRLHGLYILHDCVAAFYPCRLYSCWRGYSVQSRLSVCLSVYLSVL